MLSENRILRNYQKQAVKSWVANDYNGFFAMATGTGKTYTAINALSVLLESKTRIITIIIVPYRHLIHQWDDDIKKLLPNIDVIKVSSEFQNWESRVREKIFMYRYNDLEENSVILCTFASYKLDRFQKYIRRSKTDKLFIVDEAHNYVNYIAKEKNIYKYKLGLSATPKFNNNTDKTKELLEYFGNNIYEYGLKSAIDNEYLVRYNYHPIFVYLTEYEETEYRKIQSQIAYALSSDNVKKRTMINILIGKRDRIIARSSEKDRMIEEVVESIEPKDHIIVYCGDGKVYSDNLKEEINHIDTISKRLHKCGYKSSQFTANETFVERVNIIDDFSRGTIECLVAIRCLDEGINIPSIKTALLLASRNNIRDHIQRRGRILRRHPGKQLANIYDIVVLPVSNIKSVIVSELTRYYEYSRLSTNVEELNPILLGILKEYSMSLDELNVMKEEE